MPPVTLTYSTELLHRAVRAYWWRATGWTMRLGILVLGGLFVTAIVSGDRSWLIGVLGLAFIIATWLTANVYFAHRSNSLAKLRNMGAPTAVFIASEDSFSFISGAGSSTLPWSSVVEVWRFDGFWLLLFSKAQFVTLPLASLPQELQAFVLERVRAAGGIVDRSAD